MSTPLLDTALTDHDERLTLLRQHNQRKGLEKARQAIQDAIAGHSGNYPIVGQLSGLHAAVSIIDGLMGEVDADKILP